MKLNIGTHTSYAIMEQYDTIWVLNTEDHCFCG